MVRSIPRSPARKREAGSPAFRCKIHLMTVLYRQSVVLQDVTGFSDGEKLNQRQRLQRSGGLWWKMAESRSGAVKESNPRMKLGKLPFCH